MKSNAVIYACKVFSIKTAEPLIELRAQIIYFPRENEKNYIFLQTCIKKKKIMYKTRVHKLKSVCAFFNQFAAV